jgi:dsRNA-specific ribonuclease
MTGILTEVRQALVNNKFLAFLAVKHKFHKYLLYENNDVFSKINEFIEFIEQYSPDRVFIENVM